MFKLSLRMDGFITITESDDVAKFSVNTGTKSRKMPRNTISAV